MKSFLHKLSSGAAAVAIFLVAAVMASLGLSLMVFLALFALAVLGLGMLAAPILALTTPADQEDAKEAVA